MISHIRHVGLNVKDIDRSIAFYRKLGFSLFSRTTELWGEKIIDVAKMRAKDGALTVLELVQGDWCNHFAIQANDILITGLPLATGYMRKNNVAFIQDPDGHYIELVEVKG